MTINAIVFGGILWALGVAAPAVEPVVFAGRWESDRRVGEGAGVNCSYATVAGVPDGRGQPQYSLDLKVGRADKLGGSLTVRSATRPPSAGNCVAYSIVSRKHDIEDVVTDARTVRFSIVMESGGKRTSAVWHGELVYADTLVLRRDAIPSGDPDSGDLLFHPPDQDKRIHVDSVVSVEGGGPAPVIRVTFSNVTPLRLVGGVRAAGRLSNRPIISVRSNSTVELAPSSYRVDALDLPPGYIVKAIAVDRTDLMREDLNLLRNTGRVRIAITLGKSSSTSKP